MYLVRRGGEKGANIPLGGGMMWATSVVIGMAKFVSRGFEMVEGGESKWTRMMSSEWVKLEVVPLQQFFFLSRN